MKKIIVLGFLVAGFLTGNTQTPYSLKGKKLPQPVCYSTGEVNKSFVPPPRDIINQLKSGAEKKSDIIVDYSLFPQEAKDAFEYAVDIWEHIIESPVPIYVEANWRSKPKNVLGSCGPSDYFTNFKNIPHENVYYPVAIVEKLSQQQLTGPGLPDMIAEFNKTVDWYFGTDGNTPDSLHDFVTVVMHEMGHGLGITGFFYVSGDVGSSAYVEIGDLASFDLLVFQQGEQQLSDTSLFQNPSEKLKNALTSNALYAKSPAAMTQNSPYLPRLFAPREFDDGSSIYHLNDDTYGVGNENSLMTPYISKGEAIHDPGPITRGIMADIGWMHMYISHHQVKDIEEIKPLNFEINIESDFAIDTSSLFVYYSIDAFKSKKDSLPLLWSAESNSFAAELIPKKNASTIHYYVEAGDVKNRKFTIPSEAPRELYAINIGPDNIQPTISHNVIPYFLNFKQNLEITTKVEDNLGIDTVFVEYSLNGVEQAPFGLHLDEENMYTGEFEFDLENLKDGDVITYNISAIDASLARNKKKIPFKDKFSFKVEEIFSPVAGYSNDFNTPTNHFVISDFDIFTASGFEDAALHSSHPYLSPRMDNTYWNFATILKIPIILYEDAVMSFDEVVLVEPGEPGTKFGDDEFWDYVIIEASKDLGKNWLPLIDGYDSNENILWTNAYNESIVDQTSVTAGKTAYYLRKEINLLGNGNFNTGDTILIRFRLVSDPYANGWGWAIDNIKIQQTVSSALTKMSDSNIKVYPNPFRTEINVSMNVQKETDDIEFEVYNSVGQKIYSRKHVNVFNEIKEEINLSKHGAGLFFISVRENGKQIFSQKVIKK